MLELLELRIYTLDQMSILNITLFAASLIMLLLLMCIFTPVERFPHLSQELALNQTISQPELATTINESVESMLNQPSPTSYDPFYDVSKAIPGTLDLTPRRFCLRIIYVIVTPSTWAAPVTTSALTIANGAGAAGIAALLISFFYTT